MSINLEKSQMFDKNSLFLHEVLGEAKYSNSHNYEMLLVGGNLPAIRNETTGKTFLFSWEDLIKIAVKCGINETTGEGVKV